MSESCHGLLVPGHVVHVAIAATSGGIGAFVVYPLDFIKCQMQTEQGRFLYEDGFDCFRQHVTKSPLGFLDLYRGCLVNVLGVAPEKMIKLNVNAFVRAALLAKFGSLSILSEMAAGALAGTCQVLVTNPLEVVKVRMQTSPKSLKDTLSGFESISSFYEGSIACIARDMIFSACLFPLYAHINTEIPTWFPDIPQFYAGILSGTLAGAPAAIIATPADFLKTRIQEAHDSDDETELQQRNESALAVATKIYSNEGPIVFFSGWLERMIRSGKYY